VSCQTPVALAGQLEFVGRADTLIGTAKRNIVNYNYSQLVLLFNHHEKAEPTMAITGLHTLLYSSEVDAFRVAMRDVFEFPHVAFDNGFMIFDCPPATMEPHPGPPDFDVHSTDRVTHEVGFVCDEIEATVAELRAKGIEFRGEPKDEGWGKVIVMVLPGGVEMVLYEPND
jgi:hypothetical protein